MTHEYSFNTIFFFHSNYYVHSETTLTRRRFDYVTLSLLSVQHSYFFNGTTVTALWTSTEFWESESDDLGVVILTFRERPKRCLNALLNWLLWQTYTSGFQTHAALAIKQGNWTSRGETRIRLTSQKASRKLTTEYGVQLMTNKTEIETHFKLN